MRLNSSKQAQAPLCASPAARIPTVRLGKNLMRAPAPPLAGPHCCAAPPPQQVQSTTPQQRLHSNAESARAAEPAANANQGAFSNAPAANVAGNAVRRACACTSSWASQTLWWLCRAIGSNTSGAGGPARTLLCSTGQMRLQASHCWATLWSMHSCRCQPHDQACD